LSAITPNASLAYSADRTAPGAGSTASDRGPGGLSKAAWIKIGTVAFLLVAIFWPNIRRLWLKTNPTSNHPEAANWQHAIFVPLIGLYYLYVNREQLLAAPLHSRRIGAGRRDKDLRTLGWMFALTWVLPVLVGFALNLHQSFFGLQLLAAVTLLFANVVLSLYVPSAQLGFIILVQGLALSAYGIYPGQNDFVWDFGMVVTVFGVVLMLTGWDVMKVAWFPIVFLVCMLPWPGLVYSWVAGPLQTLAARAAVFTLRLTGVDALRSGTKMLMLEPDGLRVLNVAEACAGLRSLMTFITVGAAIAFLSNRPLWQRIVITLSAIPIAVFCNVMRVTGQGLLDHYVSRDLALGFAHQFVGVIMLIPAFLLILLVAWVLDHLFIEEVDEKDRLRAKGGAAAKKREEKVITIPRQQPAPAVAAAAVAAPAPTAAPVQRPALTTPPRPGAPRTPPAARPAGPALLGGAKPQAANPAAPKPQPAQTQQPQQRREQP